MKSGSKANPSPWGPKDWWRSAATCCPLLAKPENLPMSGSLNPWDGPLAPAEAGHRCFGALAVSRLQRPTRNHTGYQSHSSPDVWFTMSLCTNHHLAKPRPSCRVNSTPLTAPDLPLLCEGHHLAPSYREPPGGPGLPRQGAVSSIPSAGSGHPETPPV